MSKLHCWGIYLVVGFVLTACGNTSSAPDEVLPTVAILGESTAEASVIQSSEPVATPTAEKTPVSIPSQVVVSTVPPSHQMTPTALDPTYAAAIGADLGVFPDNLVTGEQVTLRGLLTVVDASVGLAFLTDLRQRKIDLLIDAFTAEVADQQLVEIVGEVIDRPESETGQAIRMTSIRLLAEVNFAESTSDPHQSAVTASPPGG